MQRVGRPSIVTIDKENHMNKLEMFDHALKTIVEQGGFSVNENGHCLYLNSDGYRCGAGSFIAPQNYLPEFEYCGVWWTQDDYDLAAEGESVSELEARKKLVQAVAETVGEITQEKSDFIRRIQKAHDNGSAEDCQYSLAADSEDERVQSFEKVLYKYFSKIAEEEGFDSEELLKLKKRITKE